MFYWIWAKKKAFFSTLKRKVIWVLAGVVAASAAVAVPVVDQQINPYVETPAHFAMAVPEQLPEQGRQMVRFSKDLPEMAMTKWGGEVAMKVRYVSSREAGVNTAKGNRPLFSKNVEWVGRNETVRGYRIDEQNYEFEVELASKPTTNTFDFVIEGTENLDFFYQPALTRQEIGEGAQRPENVVGSYAVYHKTKANHEISKTNYATGKAFHIYRPKAIDASGAEVWAELLYDDAGNLSVKVPQEFLDKAAYPVRVDPTFGYTTIGASFGQFYRSFSGAHLDRVGTTFVAPESGTIDSLHYALSASAGALSGFFAINEEDSGGVGSHGELEGIEGEIAIDSPTEFNSVTGFSSTITGGTSYILNMVPAPDSYSIVNIMFDQTGAGGSGFYSEAGAYSVGGYQALRDEDPWTDADTSAGSDTAHSIYATYTASAQTPAHSKSQIVE